ncbi:16S rRNA methyltransferase [Clostridiales bacterium PH28_bin88]|nr:16S rRNA methyltransferase [Clostridiales bacterium PH28_bin88]
MAPTERGRKDGFSPRELALRTLYQVEAEGAFANLALNRALQHSGLKKLDRGFVTELVYGVVRSSNTLEWVLQQLMDRSLDKTPPWIRGILKLGAYQLLYMDKVPVSAACNEAVELARKYGHPGTVRFVNGVLRNLARRREEVTFPPLDRDPVAHISLAHSHPEWLVSRWVKRFGVDATIALCRFNNQPADNSVRTNTLKTSREELVGLLALEGVKAEPGRYTPESLDLSGFTAMDHLRAFREGMFLMQDEASQMVAHLLRPKPGEVVVDACAAPGTKTTHLAQLMGDRGKILAWDVHQHKLGLIEGNCRRLGIHCVTVSQGDASRLGTVLGEVADRLLIDAPCSGTGVLRRRPDARWRKSPEKLPELRELQLQILAGAVGCLKPGGVLVYSTCSIEDEENLDNVRRLLALRRDLVMEDISKLLPFIPEREEDRKSAAAGYLQFLPHVHGTDGFFMARIRRVVTGV